MAYWIRPDQADENFLNYELEGGDRTLKTDLLDNDGMLWRGIDASGCFQFRHCLPETLFGSIPERIVLDPGQENRTVDFAQCGSLGGAYIVSNKAMSLIEQIEPNAHQFVAIPGTVSSTRTILPEKFYIMNVVKQLLFVDEKRSSVYWATLPPLTNLPAPAMKYLKFIRGTARVLVVRKSVVDGHHLWGGGKNMFLNLLLCSDKLRDAIVEARLNGLVFEPLPEC